MKLRALDELTNLEIIEALDACSNLDTDCCTCPAFNTSQLNLDSGVGDIHCEYRLMQEASKRLKASKPIKFCPNCGEALT